MTARSFYSKRALAQRYGVHEGTLDRWTREGRFPTPIKIAGAKGVCRWPSDVIEGFEAQATVERPLNQLESAVP